MTTMIACQSRNFFDFKKLLILATIGIVFITAVQLNLHAYATHLSEAEAVHQCFSKNGEIQRWESPLGKQFRLCNNGDWFGIQVMVKNANGTFREVTSFIRKIHGKPVLDLPEVEKYLEVACKALKITP